MRKTLAGLTLRPCLPSDQQFLFRLGERSFGAYAAYPEGTLAAMMSEPTAVSMIGELERAPVGFFVLDLEQLGRPLGPWQRPAAARLNAIAVVADRRGRGVGRYLLGQAEELARRYGAVSMTLMTAETNTVARRLFSSGGYQPILVVPRAYARGQGGVVMNKAL